MANSIRSALARFRKDRRGNVVVTAALAAPVLLGSMGVGAEVASWYSDRRALQNVADSAAIAAATNAGSTFDKEAKAVAAKYGFVDGVKGVTVTALANQACPSGGADECYKVTVGHTRPLLLAHVVGYTGDLKIDGTPAKLIQASAVAKQALGPRPYCVLALAGSGDPQALRTNGAPNADLSGCNVMSNSAAQCNGHNLKAEIGDAHGTNNGCGKKANSNVKKIDDPYTALQANVPAVPCTNGFPAVPKQKKDPDLPVENQIGGYTAWSGVKTFCGDVQLMQDTIIQTGPEGAVLVIRDGALDLNNNTLKTDNGSALTIVFTGTDPNRFHGPTGDGTLDIAAPKTGSWAGVAMYQSTTLPFGKAVNLSYAGNSPTWKVTGLVYLPKASVTFSGAVNKSSNGLSCFVLVVDNLTVNGTGSILTSGQCAAAGLKPPTSPQPSRGQLVS